MYCCLCILSLSSYVCFFHFLLILCICIFCLILNLIHVLFIYVLCLCVCCVLSSYIICLIFFLCVVYIFFSPCQIKGGFLCVLLYINRFVWFVYICYYYMYIFLTNHMFCFLRGCMIKTFFY